MKQPIVYLQNLKLQYQIVLTKFVWLLMRFYLVQSVIQKDAFGLQPEADAIRVVVNKSLAEGIVNEDISGKNKAYKTSEVGDWLAKNI